MDVLGYNTHQPTVRGRRLILPSQLTEVVAMTSPVYRRIPPRCKDLTGQQFGRLTVVSFIERKNARTYWLCRCECGNEKTIRADVLVNGSSQSCGCINKEWVNRWVKTREPYKTHGMSKTPTWNTWRQMIRRCTKQTATQYPEYGGRGIAVCDRWMVSFDSFLADMGEKPKGTTLDRVDNNGNYEPGNCRWATMQEQSRNRRSNRSFLYRGKMRTVTEIAEILGVNPNTLTKWLKRNGWDIEKAVISNKQSGYGPN